MYLPKLEIKQIGYWRGKIEGHFSNFDAQLEQSSSSVSFILV